MPDMANVQSIQEPRYRAAFARLAEKIRADSVGELAPVNLDVMSAVRTTEGILPKIANQRATIAKQLPSFDVQLFDELEDRALALGHAQTVYENAQLPPPILPSLYDEATSAHDIALAEAKMLIKRGLLPEQSLSRLKGGNGFRNLIDDMFALSEALKSHWEKVSTRTTLTLDELNHMEGIADRMNQTLGIREQMPELQASAARDRQSAYTLFVQAYGEVRAAIAYVRRKEDDVDSIMPSLFAGRGGSKRKGVTDAPEKPAAPVPPPTVENRGTPAASSTVTPALPPTGAATEIKAEPAKSTSVSDNGPFMH